MASMIEAALDHLYSTVHGATVGGETVTIHRGAASTTVKAVLERTKIVPPSFLGLSPGSLDLAAPSPKNMDSDFSILAADYKFNGTAVTPQAGDLIKRTVSGVVNVYECMASSGTGAVWEWLDGYSKRMVIHTKLTGTD